jgi:hypothetical protein
MLRILFPPRISTTARAWKCHPKRKISNIIQVRFLPGTIEKDSVIETFSEYGPIEKSM